MSEKKIRLTEKEDYWINLSNAYTEGSLFKTTKFPSLRRQLTHVGDFKIPWNEELEVTRELTNSPLLCLATFCTRDATISRTVRIVYEPVDNMVMIHWDCNFEFEHSNKYPDLADRLRESLERVAGDGQGFKSIEEEDEEEEEIEDDEEEEEEDIEEIEEDDDD